MSVPLAIPSQVPQMIFSLWAQITPERLYACSTLTESALYASIKQNHPDDNRWVKRIREFSTGNIHNIQMLFSTINSASLAFYVYKLTTELQDKFSLSSSLGAFAVGSAITVSASVISHLFARAYCPPKTEKETIQIKNANGSEVTVTQEIPFLQKLDRILLGTKIIVETAFACLAKDKISLALDALGSGASLYKNFQFQWLNFSVQNNNFTNGGCFLTATYHMLNLPTKTTATCPICSDENKKADVVFCNNHTFCKECLADSVAFKVQGLTFKSLERMRIISQSGSRYDYEVSLQQEHLPNCPSCRTSPKQNGLSVSVYDRGLGRRQDAVVTVLPEKGYDSLFANFYAAYNVVQAGLTYLQSYPELAGNILKIQKLLVVTDVLGGVLSTYYLAKKWLTDCTWKNKVTKTGQIWAAASATALFSHFAVPKLNQYLAPALSLETLSELTKSFASVQWNSPVWQQVIQKAYVYRIISSLALSFFSDRKKTHWLSTAAQLASFVGISRLKWIEVSAVLINPLRNIKALQITSYFLINASCATETHLKSTLASISRYAKAIWGQSSLTPSWATTRAGGVEVYREFVYRATVQPIPSPQCDCSITHVAEVTMQAFHSVYGLTKVFVTQT